MNLDLDRLLLGADVEALGAMAARPEERSRLRELWRRAYGIDRMMAARSLARARFGESPRPLVGRVTHAWGDAARLSGRSVARSPVEDLEKLLSAKNFGLSRFTPFVALDAEGALRAAEASAGRLTRGEALGPLDGALMAVKDELEQEGLPTRAGRAGAFRAASRDAFVVRRLREAGLVLPGKTHVTEWGMDAAGRNPHVDMPRNPRAPDRAAGGSSTGSAVAVALGLCPVALASDGGGSARIPAALCGIRGLKTTFGLLSRGGDLFGGGSMHALGLLGRRVADMAEALAILGAVEDPRDPDTAFAPERARCVEGWRRAPGRGAGGCVIGVPAQAWKDLDPSLASPALEALARLEALGARCVDVDLPILEHVHAAGFLVVTTETQAALAELLRPGRGEGTSPELLALLHVASEASVAEYAVALRVRSTLRSRLALLFERIDALALPATRALAPPYPAAWDRRPVFADGDARALCAHTFAANLAGLPAASVPVGEVGGLPVGLQLVADAWDEATLLTLMACLEPVENVP